MKPKPQRKTESANRRSVQPDCYAALVQKWRRRACRLYRRADKTTENAPNIYYRVAAQEAGKYARELAAELRKQHNRVLGDTK